MKLVLRRVYPAILDAVGTADEAVRPRYAEDEEERYRALGDEDKLRCPQADLLKLMIQPLFATAVQSLRETCSCNDEFRARLKAFRWKHAGQFGWGIHLINGHTLVILGEMDDRVYVVF